MPPEQMQGDTLTLKSDVWAMGVVLWELATRKQPWAVSSPLPPLFFLSPRFLSPSSSVPFFVLSPRYLVPQWLSVSSALCPSPSLWSPLPPPCPPVDLQQRLRKLNLVGR